MFYAPALLLPKVVDPTGAGDTFAGGFMGYLASTDDTSFENMKRALVYGSALASFSVQEFGTAKIREVTSSELDGRINEFKSLMSFTHK